MPRKSARIAARQQEQSSDTRDKDNDDGSGGLHSGVGSTGAVGAGAPPQKMLRNKRSRDHIMT